jgi:hypothetical protein
MIRKRVPKFQTEAEEAEWWDRHREETAQWMKGAAAAGKTTTLSEVLERARQRADATTSAPLEPDAPSVYRKELPRLYELRDLADPSAPNTYFRDFECKLRKSELLLEACRRWEEQLAGLDADVWRCLKSEAVPYLKSRDPDRGWQQLFDILGQAAAYNYLKKSVGCTTVGFIPRSSKETPDLVGFLNSGRLLCEVKTINISDNDLAARKRRDVVPSSDRLDQGFIGKLDAVIAKARNQLCAYDTAHEARHLVYLNLCFDDWAPHYHQDYLRQIEQHLEECPPGIEYVLGRGGLS